MAEQEAAFTTKVITIRRERGMTQSELADQIGCKQSAISMFERGNPQAIASEKQQALAKLLDIPWTNPRPAVLVPASTTARDTNYCPHYECPSNVPYRVGPRLLAIPRSPASTTGKYCRYCGEVCETHCPTCKAPYSHGACCPACGSSYIPVPPSDASAWEQWSQARHLLLQTLP
ncbi:MAG: helix-turn-helix domain-containing protein [Kiritimatiellia bacterium]